MKFLETQSKLVELEGSREQGLVTAAKGLGYNPASGLSADYENATAYDYQGMSVVSVPLLGTDLPQVTKMTFMTTGGKTSVTEMASRMIDVDHVKLEMWQDNAQTKNVVIENPDAVSSADEVEQVGINWGKLKACLNDAGVAWAVLAIISVTCSAACATAVACIPCISLAAGFTSGAIGACVRKAFA